MIAAKTTGTDTKGSFRDSVATISKEGKRNFIHPKKPKGRLYNLRTYTSIGYLIVFFTLPFLKLNGQPLFMLNVLERKFIIFGMVFWPQDFFLFGLAMLTFMVFIILFTAVFGRVFCGWACPQTIFMEMVFRKIEYWIDGDAAQQKLLKAAPWNSRKIMKRALKAVIFFSISFIIANFFLAYLISMDEVLRYMHEPFAKHIGTFSALLVFTGIFFFVYWWFREQACIVVCPYGRLQGVLLDKNSIVVAYDYVRGEERAKFKKNEDRTAGDCIDCHQCVNVCPTGIDIRNGTQLECVNCTACIDACDHMMKSVGLPPNLIRYASENNIAKNQQLRLTTRIKAYSLVLIALLGILTTLLVSRTDVDVTMLRANGQTFLQQPNGMISNLYNLKLANKTYQDRHLELKLENIKGEIQLVGSPAILVKKEGYIVTTLFINIPRSDLRNWKTALKLGLYEGDKKIKSISASFLGPEIYE
jgi:cytochrome c oxidase accessory protein FixG